MKTLSVIIHFERFSMAAYVPFISSEGFSIYKAFETYPEAKEIVTL